VIVVGENAADRRHHLHGVLDRRFEHVFHDVGKTRKAKSHERTSSLFITSLLSYDAKSG
jgi:hypothetical protein